MGNHRRQPADNDFAIRGGYRKEYLIESYDEAENEARDMIYTPGNRAEHQKGKHDDRVFARAIAWQMRMRPRPRVTLI